MSSSPIVSPAKFASVSATSYADANGGLNLVSASAPLPVSLIGATIPAALAGTATASGTYGGFVPVRGVPVVLVLSGSWQGNVRVVRSTDGGITLNPLTIAGINWAQFTANACEAVWEENDPTARLSLVISLTSGSVTYRLGH